MTPLELNDILFLLTPLALTVIGFSSVKKHISATEFLHQADLHKDVVSLTAATPTLGTGLVYHIYGAQPDSLPMFLFSPSTPWSCGLRFAVHFTFAAMGRLHTSLAPVYACAVARFPKDKGELVDVPTFQSAKAMPITIFCSRRDLVRIPSTVV